MGKPGGDLNEDLLALFSFDALMSYCKAAALDIVPRRFQELSEYAPYQIKRYRRHRFRRLRPLCAETAHQLNGK